MKHILTITGASGSGKDTLVDCLLCLNHNEPENIPPLALEFCDQWHPYVAFRELISHTTRLPRDGEKEGSAYYFVDFDTFEEIEKVEETEYAGNHYCLSANELANIEDGGWGVVIVDQHGRECIENFVSSHKEEYSLTSIFLTITPEKSEARMKFRGDKPAAIAKRLAQQIERNEYVPADESKYQLILSSSDEQSLYDNVMKIQDFLIHN